MGNTCDNIDDYHESCPWGGVGSPDVVYAYTPSADGFISLDLCGEGTQYDTKLYVYAQELTSGNPYACNDDGCTNSWTSHVSRIPSIVGMEGP